MIRKMLELRTGKMSDEQFKRVMKNTTDDIKFNRIRFKKMTYMKDALEIAEQCFKLDQRIKKGDSESHPIQIHCIRHKQNIQVEEYEKIHAI